ncbi:MAG TPA: aminoglycoside phosphotransferase family protein [Ktedonobacterales bacterium]|nr:aminoglycoside phosphotransferase family protein [Ktedonobacterales bacterium]
MYPLPAALVRMMTAMHGDAGAAWLAGLPPLLDECARRWSLTLGPPYPAAFSYVAPATRADGTLVVLKVGIPDREMRTGLEALRLYDGHGLARLLAVDEEHGAHLLERLVPGTQLATLADDAAATSIAASVMRQLRRPAPAGHRYPTVAEWGRGFARLRQRYGGGTGPLPATLVEQAERLFVDLTASMAPPVVLHGDLHYFNIVAATRAPWLAIDPKGVVGEPAYETGALLRNPMPHLLAMPDPARLTRRRVDQLAEELGFDRARVRGWGVAQAVLSAWWSIEDSDSGWEFAIGVAELLAAVPE